jgi:ABC-2 type transport system permease protein
MAGLAFLMQIFFNQKYVGFLGVLVWFVLDASCRRSIRARLYRFAQHSAESVLRHERLRPLRRAAGLVRRYWLLLVAALLVVGHLLWTCAAPRAASGSACASRGSGSRSRPRRRWSSSSPRSLATGCYIYYNTNVLNEYRTTKDGEKDQAENREEVQEVRAPAAAAHHRRAGRRRHPSGEARRRHPRQVHARQQDRRPRSRSCTSWPTTVWTSWK